MVEAFSSPTCIRTVDPCADTSIVAEPFPHTLAVTQGTPRTIDLTQYGVPWYDEVGAGTGSCGGIEYRLESLNGGEVTWAEL